MKYSMMVKKVPFCNALDYSDNDKTLPICFSHMLSTFNNVPILMIKKTSFILEITWVKLCDPNAEYNTRITPLFCVSSVYPPLIAWKKLCLIL